MHPCAVDQQQQQANELPVKYKFDPKDKFYLAPPMCGLLHYRDGAILSGILEVACLSAGVFGFISESFEDSSFVIVFI